MAGGGGGAPGGGVGCGYGGSGNGNRANDHRGQGQGQGRGFGFGNLGGGQVQGADARNNWKVPIGKPAVPVGTMPLGIYAQCNGDATEVVRRLRGSYSPLRSSKEDVD
jgi:hypothetical protein